ncbi:MAG: hypothetical protein FJW31_10840 [Acidobacteria bacterium]|nr:hypothetical protein [Acidobacteriota bacterium]
MAEQLLASGAAHRWLPWFDQIFREGRDVTAEPATKLLLRLASGDCDAQSGHFFCIPAEDLGALRTTQATGTKLLGAIAVYTGGRYLMGVVTRV